MQLCPSGPDYQRLELLGDAVIEFLVTTALIADRSGDTAQTLHDARAQVGYLSACLLSSPMVYRRFHLTNSLPLFFFPQITSNALFARLCLAMGWQHLLVTESSDILHNIHAFEDSLKEARALSALEPPAAKQLAINTALAEQSVRAPKYLADVVEAVMGAVFADSGSLLCCADALQRMLNSLGEELPAVARGAAGHGLFWWAQSCALVEDDT